MSWDAIISKLYEVQQHFPQVCPPSRFVTINFIIIFIIIDVKTAPQ
jgi:hypothetical protein